MHLSIQLLDQNTAAQARQDLSIHCQALRLTTISKASALRQAQILQAQAWEHYSRQLAEGKISPLDAAQAIVSLEILTHCLSQSPDQFFRFRDPQYSGNGAGGTTTGDSLAPPA
jgi:hypothetical protein